MTKKVSRDTYMESRACWKDQGGASSLQGAETWPQMKLLLKNDDWIYQQIEHYSDFADEHCACKTWKKKKEYELFAKMAFYKNSNPSHQTLIFQSPPPSPPGTATSGNWVSELLAKFQAFQLISEGPEGRFGSCSKNTMWVVWCLLVKSTRTQ